MIEPTIAAPKGFKTFNVAKQLKESNFDEWDREFRDQLRAEGINGAWISIENYPPVKYRPPFPTKATVAYDQSATPVAERLTITAAMEESLVAKAVDRHLVLLAAYDAADIAIFNLIMSPSCTSQESKQKFLANPKWAGISVGVLNSDWTTLYEIIVETHLTARYGTSAIAISRAKSQAEAEVAKFAQKSTVSTPVHFKDFRNLLRKARMRGAIISGEDAVMILFSSLFNPIARTRMFESNRAGKAMPTSLDIAERLIVKSETEQELEREIENDGRKLRGGQHSHSQSAGRVHVNKRAVDDESSQGEAVFTFDEEGSVSIGDSSEIESSEERTLAFRSGRKLTKEGNSSYSPEQKAKFAKLAGWQKDEVRRLQAARDKLDKELEAARNAKPDGARPPQAKGNGAGQADLGDAQSKGALTVSFKQQAVTHERQPPRPPPLGRKKCYYCQESSHQAKDCKNSAAKRRFIIAQATVMMLAEEDDANEEHEAFMDADAYNEFNGVVAEASYEYYSDKDEEELGENRVLMTAERTTKEVRTTLSGKMMNELERRFPNVRRIAAREPTLEELDQQTDLDNYPEFPMAGRQVVMSEERIPVYAKSVFDTRNLTDSETYSKELLWTRGDEPEQKTPIATDLRADRSSSSSKKPANTPNSPERSETLKTWIQSEVERE